MTDYRAHLQSPEWRVMRRLKLEDAGYRCQVCNGDELLQVHHRTYDRLGRERFQDLTVLCDACHAKHHDKLPKLPQPALRVVEPPAEPLADLPSMDDVRRDQRWRQDRIAASQQNCLCCAPRRALEFIEAA